MSELKQLFVDSFPTEAPSSAARSRVVEMALAADRQASVARHRNRLIRRGFGFGLATLAIGAGIVMAPSVTTAAYIRHLEGVVRDARSAHIVMWTPTADGGQKRVREMWYEGGRWRIDAPMFDTVTITDATRKWIYNPSRKSVRVSSLDRPFMGGKGFTLSSMLGDRSNGNVRIEDAGAFKAVRMENKFDHSILVMWVDKQTDYPVRGEVQSPTPNGVKTSMRFECEFNRPVARDRFTASFPTGTKVIDTVGGERFWQKELSKSLARFDVPQPGLHDRVVLRNVQVTENGSIFLLYSGKIDESNFTLTDDLGNVYARCDGFQPQAYRMDQDTHEITPEKGILVGGAELKGGWWTPLVSPGRNWKGRTLTFALASVWYKADPEKMKRLPKGAMVTTADMEEVRTPVGKWSIHLDAPTCGLTPDYMPYMGMGPQTEFDLAREEENARVRYLMANDRFAEAEPILRNEIRRIEQYEAQTGQTWVKSSFFYDMYRILKSEGRSTEAVEWLRRVQDQPGGARGDKNIEHALSAEGL